VSNSSVFTPALLITRSFVLFAFAVHETRIIFLCPFISKASRRVASFFTSVQLSQLLKLALCSDVPIACPLFYLVRNSVIHPPSSVISDPKHGNLSTYYTLALCSDVPIACPLFYLVRNSVIHPPSSVISDPKHGNLSTYYSCSF